MLQSIGQQTTSAHQIAQTRFQYHFAELASGKKAVSLNSPATLAIGRRMLGRVGLLEAANQNLQFGSSRAQTIDGYLQQGNEVLGRLQELSIRAGDATLNATDRQLINNEAQELLTQLNDNAATASFNGQRILQGGTGDLAVGPEGQSFTLHSGNLQLTTLGIDGLDLSTATGVQTAMETLGGAQEQVSSQRVELAVELQRLQGAYEQNISEEANLLEAGARLADADMARAVTDLTSAQISADLALAMQAQGSDLAAAAAF